MAYLYFVYTYSFLYLSIYQFIYLSMQNYLLFMFALICTYMQMFNFHSTKVTKLST